MLKAFQGQIDRVEMLLAELDERETRADAAGGALAERLVTYEAGVEAALERGRAWENEAATRLERAAEETVAPARSSSSK